MADLITLARARYNINQPSFSAAEDTTISALISAISRAIKRYCRREFDSQSFDQLYSGSGDVRLVLDEYPILSVARVAGAPKTVLTIRNSSSSNQRATVAVTSTGLTLVRVASGITTTDTSVTWAGNATVAAVKNAVNALGNGWSATITDNAYSLWASSDLRAVQGVLTAKDKDAPLRLYSEDTDDFTIDAARGWLLRGHLGITWPLGDCWEQD